MIELCVGTNWRYATSNSQTALRNGQTIVHRVILVEEKHHHWLKEPHINAVAACGTSFGPIFVDPDIWHSAAEYHIPRKRMDVKCSRCRNTTKKPDGIGFEYRRHMVMAVNAQDGTLLL